MNISNQEYIMLREQLAEWKAMALCYRDMLIKNKLIQSDEERLVKMPKTTIKDIRYGE